MQASITQKDKDLARALEEMRNSYAALLKQTVSLADSAVRESALKSQQFITPYTLEAERMTNLLTGIPVDTSITMQEKSLQPINDGLISSRIDEKTKELSKAAFRLTSQLADFKKKLLLDVVKCKTYTANFPMEIHHMWEEANRYLKMLEELDAGKNIMRMDHSNSNEAFWSHIMADHSRFTASRLDPYEAALIQSSLLFAQEFDVITSMLKNEQQNNPQLTGQALSAAEGLQDFQIACTRGIMDCSIQSLILPLRSDHHIRETYFLLWLLAMAQKAA